MKMSDIKEGEGGVKLVSIKMHKTDDYIQIPLLREAQNIIKSSTMIIPIGRHWVLYYPGSQTKK